MVANDQTVSPVEITAKKSKKFSWFLNLNLRIKLAVAFLALIILVQGLVTIVSGIVVSTTTVRQTGANLSTFAQGKAREIGQTIDREVDALRTLSLNTWIRNVAEAKSKTNASDLAEIETLDQQWRAADAANSNADPIVAGVLNNEISDELHKFQEAFPQHAEVFITDRHGANIAATNRTSDYYQADEAWWQAAFDNGRGGVYIGQPEFDESANTYAINVALPLYANNRSDIVGVIRTTVNIDALTGVLASGRFGQTGRVEVYLPDGREIEIETDSDGDKLEIEEGSLSPDILAQIQVPGAFVETSHSGKPSLIGGRSLAAEDSQLSHAEALAELDWTVIAAQDRAEALQANTAANQATALVGITGLILAGLLAYFVAQYLSAPITRLTQVAHEIAGGNLEARAEVEAGDEIGQLAATFNLHDGSTPANLVRLRRSIPTP